MWSTTGRLVVILAHTYTKNEVNTPVTSTCLTVALLLQTNRVTTVQMVKPPLLPVWSPDPSHLCVQMEPGSDRRAGTGTSAGSECSHRLSGCSSRMLDCGSETQTLDFLQRTTKVFICTLCMQKCFLLGPIEYCETY